MARKKEALGTMDENTTLYKLFLNHPVGQPTPQTLSGIPKGLVYGGVENPAWNAVARCLAVPIRDVVSEVIDVP